MYENQISILKASLTDLTKLREEETQILIKAKRAEKEMMDSYQGQLQHKDKMIQSLQEVIESNKVNLAQRQ